MGNAVVPIGYFSKDGKPIPIAETPDYILRATGAGRPQPKGIPNCTDGPAYIERDALPAKSHMGNGGRTERGSNLLQKFTQHGFEKAANELQVPCRHEIGFGILVEIYEP
jgi:hypothetical protein